MSALPANFQEWKQNLSFCLNDTDEQKWFGHLSESGQMYLAKIRNPALSSVAIVCFLDLPPTRSNIAKIQYKYRYKIMTSIQIGSDRIIINKKDDDNLYDSHDSEFEDDDSAIRIIGMVPRTELFQLPFPIFVKDSSPRWKITARIYKKYRCKWVNSLQLAKKGDWNSFSKKNMVSMMAISRKYAVTFNFVMYTQYLILLTCS